jgi:hypothetical protein
VISLITWFDMVNSLSNRCWIYKDRLSGDFCKTNPFGKREK